MLRRILLLALLPGCTLVDQTTFNPDAGKAPVIAATAAPAVAAAPAPPDPRALIVVRLDQAGDFRPALRQAVALARARKPGVVFDVVEMVAPGTEASAGAGAATVARGIEAAGVPPRQVNLLARTEAVPGREVRVYVR